MNLDTASLFTCSFASKHFEKSCLLCGVISDKAANLRLLESKVICWAVLFGTCFFEPFNIYHTFIRVVKLNSPCEVIFYTLELAEVEDDVKDDAHCCIQ